MLAPLWLPAAEQAPLYECAHTELGRSPWVLRLAQDRPVEGPVLKSRAWTIQHERWCPERKSLIFAGSFPNTRRSGVLRLWN